MDDADIRLECLKLAHRHDRDPAQVVDVAKVYEAYVSGNAHRPRRRGKKAGKPDPFAE